MSELFKIGLASFFLFHVFYTFFGTEAWFAAAICVGMSLFWPVPVKQEPK